MRAAGQLRRAITVLRRMSPFPAVSPEAHVARSFLPETAERNPPPRPVLELPDQRTRAVPRHPPRRTRHLPRRMRSARTRWDGRAHRRAQLSASTPVKPRPMMSLHLTGALVQVSTRASRKYFPTGYSSIPVATRPAERCCHLHRGFAGVEPGHRRSHGQLWRVARARPTAQLARSAVSGFIDGGLRSSGPIAGRRSASRTGPAPRVLGGRAQRGLGDPTTGRHQILPLVNARAIPVLAHFAQPSAVGHGLRRGPVPRSPAQAELPCGVGGEASGSVGTRTR